MSLQLSHHHLKMLRAQQEYNYALLSLSFNQTQQSTSMIAKKLACYSIDKNLALSIAFKVNNLLIRESTWSLSKKFLPVLGVFFLASCSEWIHKHYLSSFGSSNVFKAILEY